MSRITLDEIKMDKKPLGEGGFAKVFRGDWKGQQIAVKVWTVTTLSESEELELFRREIQCTNLCNSPYVVKFIGYSLDPIAIMTEFVDGKNMFDVIHDKKQLYSWRQFQQLALEAAQGVAHIHEKKIVHRDLKSLNYMIDKNWHVKLLDFGLSRLKEATVKLTGGRGTVRWMAPEVIDHGNYDWKVDVWSFAIVLWELVAREIPYEKFKDDFDIAAAVCDQKYRLPLPDNLPPKVQRLIEKCWAQNQQDRPTMAEVVTYLSQTDLIPPTMINIPVLDKTAPKRAPVPVQVPVEKQAPLGVVPPSPGPSVPLTQKKEVETVEKGSCCC